VVADVDRWQVEHQVREHHAEAAARDLAGDEQGSGGGRDSPEGTLDQGDDRVERGRDRPERQDQRDQHCPRDQGVLQQLQAHVLRGQALRGDTGPDDGRRQQGAAAELGGCLSGEQRHPGGAGSGRHGHQQQVGSMTRHSAPSASDLGR